MDQSVRGPEKEKKEKEKEENNCGKLLTCRLRRARQKKSVIADNTAIASALFFRLVYIWPGPPPQLA